MAMTMSVQKRLMPLDGSGEPVGRAHVLDAMPGACMVVRETGGDEKDIRARVERGDETTDNIARGGCFQARDRSAARWPESCDHRDRDRRRSRRGAPPVAAGNASGAPQ
jgi:hypothetical protein